MCTLYGRTDQPASLLDAIYHSQAASAVETASRPRNQHQQLGARLELPKMLLARALRPATRRLRCLSYLASIDQGTSSSRVILYGRITKPGAHQVELQSATTTPNRAGPRWTRRFCRRRRSGARRSQRQASSKGVRRGHYQSRSRRSAGTSTGDMTVFGTTPVLEMCPSTPRGFRWHRFIEKRHWLPISTTFRSKLMAARRGAFRT